MSETLKIARSYLHAGLGVIPIKADGSKAPALTAGHKFLKERPQEHHLKQWFSRGELGIGIPCGSVSGCLECIDFETVSAYREWLELVNAEAPGLLDMVNVCMTPGHKGEPGIHVRYRLDGRVPGSKKLALDYELDKDGKRIDAKSGLWETYASIETRGEGGYALAPGSPPSCHKSGGTYKYAGGRQLTDLAVLSHEQRGLLILAAQSLNRVPDADGEYPDKLRDTGGHGDLRPGDDFNQRGPSWAEILEPYDWVAVGTAGGVTRWRRPGKKESWSATTGLCRAQDGAELLWVFSSSAAPFEPGKGYSKFRALAILKYRGDLKECARALGKEGYGESAAGKKESSKPKSKYQEEVDKFWEWVASLRRPCETKRWTWTNLAGEHFDPIDWLIEGYLPKEGLVFLGGRKKLGKSWLCLQFAQAVAFGVNVLGAISKCGKVSYIVLEDGARRVQDRLLRRHKCPPTEKLEIITAIPPLDTREGMFEFWKIIHEKPALVILDTLAAAKSGKTDENAAGPMADLVNMIRLLAQEEHVCILVTHHHGKAVGGNPGDDMRGSSAIAAAGDVNLGLYGDGKDRAKLKGEGRDIEEFDYALQFNNPIKYGWSKIGETHDVMRQECDAEVIAVLREIGQGDSRQIADVVRKDRRTVHDRLLRLTKEGVLITFDDPNSTRGRPRKIFMLKPETFAEKEAS